MRFPNKLWQTQVPISFDDDISGNPSIAMGKDNSIYFAASVRGSHPIAGVTNNYDIAVGKIGVNGTLIWYMIFPDMNTPSDETDPVIAIGPDDELYIAYVTRGSTTNNFNMYDQITFCQFICTDRGFEDIAIARIDTVDVPVLRWVVQSGRFNSCNRETTPSIAIDKTNRLLYVGYQSSANIQCNTSPGSPNVAIVCLNLSGDYYWSDSMLLNKAGINQNAVVAADEFSNVYMAYETTVNRQPRQIEVVKYHTNLTNGAFDSFTQEWRAGDISNIVSYPLDSENPLPTICLNPSIVCDNKGRVYITFVTDGAVTEQITSGSLHDIVIVCLEPSGKRVWMHQGPRYNESPYRYIDIYQPYITCDDYNNLYVSLNTQTNDGYNILLYKLSSTSGETVWEYTNTLNQTYNAYPFARDISVRPMLPTSSVPYKRTSLAIRSGVLAVGLSIPQSIEPTTIAPTNYMTMYAFEERLYFENINAFGYINNIKSGCGCSTNGCGC